MLQRGLGVVALCVFAFAPSIADAEGLYWGLNGGWSMLDDPSNTGDTGFSIDAETENGPFFAGTLGYGFGNFRVEGEISYRKNDIDELEITQDAGVGVALGVGDLDGLVVDASGDARSLAFMASGFFDVPLRGGFKPYLGAGIGVANIAADASTLGVSIVDDDDTVFAYQLMAGIGYEVHPQIVFFSGYRYFATEDPGFTDAAGGDFDSEYQTHNIEVGFRYFF